MVIFDEKSSSGMKTKRMNRDCLTIGSLEIDCYSIGYSAKIIAVW